MKKRRSKSAKSVAVGSVATSLGVGAGSGRVTGMFAAAVFAAVVTGIAVNALALQKGRHPAPFFGRSFALPESVPAAAVPMPPARPAAVAAPATVAPKPQPAAAAPAPEPVKAGAASDPIGQLIKGNAPAKPSSSAHARPHAAQ